MNRYSGDASVLPGDWRIALRKQGYDPSDAEALAAQLCAAPGAPVWPEPELVFRAFQETPLSKVRAVILGQDPYPQADRATGLAFELAAGPTPGDSLDLIFANLESDPEVRFRRPVAGGELKAWADEGVLLLNAALTVRQSRPKSHRGAWRAFTQGVIQVINSQRDSIPVLLLGTSTSDWLRTPIDGTRHRAIPTTHPIAWYSPRIPLFRESKPFSDANTFLSAVGKRQIDWCL
ncbi:uracil-DNA glycosylase [Agromyces sp. NPDC058126]|uniref:uracil-DNA glycosylase n=1 Tax=Agromyces sp. NPDC058126 TaxID=3346350 RepID=UPI0036D78439